MIPEVIATPADVMFALNPAGCAQRVVGRSRSRQRQPAHRHHDAVPTFGLTKLALYPLVDSLTFPASPPTTPFKTTLFELIVATVVPS